MVRSLSRISANLVLAVAFALLLPSQSFAESKFLKEGMAEYAAGNYSEAAGFFGGALSTDFNNSVLHYYLGNCYVHMNQKDAAIREFRIAYALDPEKEVGKYAKQALANYGLDSAGLAETKKPHGDKLTETRVEMAPGPRPPTALEKQAEELKSLRTEQSRLSSVDAGKQGDRLVERTTNDLLDSMKYITRGGRIVQPTKLNADGASQVEYLKRLYDSQRDGYIQTGAKQSSDIQQTADCLKEQMNEQAKAGKMHLSPSGTNLYVRNYEMATPETKSITKSSATQITPSK